MIKAPNVQAFLRLLEKRELPAKTLDGSVALDGATIFGQIKNILERPAPGLRNEDLFRLKKTIKMAAIAGRAPAVAVTAINCIWDATKLSTALVPLTDFEPWSRAIDLALAAAVHWDSGQYHLERFSREHAVAHAAERLKNQGYTFDLLEGGIALDAAAFKRACARIDGLVAGLGGRAVAERIVREYVRTDRMFDGSFLYGRNVDQIGNARLPSIPWHYLFQLAMKHIHRQPSSTTAQQDWSVVVDLARDLCATLDVEPYSAYDGIDIAPKGLQDTLQDLVLYDELFSFQQWQPRYASELMDAWLSFMASKGYPVPDQTMANWCTLSGSLLKAAADDMFVVTAPTAHADIDFAAAAAMLSSMATGSDNLNHGYATPLDTAKRTAPYVPLIKIVGDLYLIPPRALLARALYEWFYKRMREAPVSKVNPPPDTLDNTMGAALEHQAALVVRGVNHDAIIAGRKYRDPLSGKIPEIDVLVETSERIFLIECKKKPLTNLARGGSSLHAIIDLSKALLDMLVQLARHEKVLRSQGRIDFLDGSSISLNGRAVEKIAVTMLDHGSLQDRMVISSIVRGLFGRQLLAASSDDQTLLQGVNKTLTDLQAELTSLAGAAEGGDVGELLRVYALGTWWLGLDALHYLSRTHRDLWAALRPLRHLTFRTGDMMTEIAYLRRAKMIT